MEIRYGVAMRIVTLLFILCIVVLYSAAYLLTEPLVQMYRTDEAYTITDRTGSPIYQEPNASGNYTIYEPFYPAALEQMVLRKEDQYFYYHPGVNPVSVARAFINRLNGEPVRGVSTITQQLTKTLLGTTNDRSLLNKLKETVLATALEVRYSKATILNMYLNSAYLGNQAQGFGQASYVYFGVPATKLTDSQTAELVAALSSPGNRNPWKISDNVRTQMAEVLDSYVEKSDSSSNGYSYSSPAGAEIAPLLSGNGAQINTTLDSTLTEHIRSELKRHTDITASYGGTHGAVVVLLVPEMEIVALVGSPDPFGVMPGEQIQMTTEPRPIGSTIKPFIYTQAFENGARPYSLVYDREFKYEIGTGFPLYPKNFDGTYKGQITLQEALANSLNTPSITLLEFIGLDQFYDRLEEKMQFLSINPLESYAHGIALGGLEMDLLTLTHYFSIFPNGGALKPLQLTDTPFTPPQNTITTDVEVFPPEYVALTESILTDRASGVEQFGIKSTLTLPHQTVAVKTGTSRDFHDNWVIGYTPDYVVGVWLGNTENKPMDGLSGSQGAGPLWRSVMEHMANTSYNKGTMFTNKRTQTYTVAGSNYEGLPDDQVESMRALLLERTLILHPHNRDTFLLESNTAISLQSDSIVTWSINGTPIATDAHHYWQPDAPGTYTVRADSETLKQEITVVVTTEKTLTQ